MTDDAATSAPRRRRLLRSPAALLVAVPVAFNLIALRAETLNVLHLNDSAVHLAMIRWARHQIASGRIPLDGWFPNFGLGSSHFHHYQTFPHILTAYVSMIFGTQRTFQWTLYVLLASWPVAIYAAARLFGWDGWRAAAAAVIAPLVSSPVFIGYEHGAYTWQGFGTWAQLWGMWLLPFALALGFRAVTGRGSYLPAAITLGVTIMCHFQTGYLAVLAIGLCVLLRRRGFIERLKRAAIVVGGAVLIASWTLVPVLLDVEWTGRSELGEGTYISDSYGAPRVLSWLFTGQLFDRGRLAVLTGLVLFGVLVCLLRRRSDDKARFVLYFGAMSLVLYFGRRTLGPLVGLLPVAGGSLMERYINGVHLAGVLFAGIGAEAIARRLAGWARSYVAGRAESGSDAARTESPRDHPLPVGAAIAVVVVLGVVVLGPAWRERWSYNSAGAAMIRQQRSIDATDGRDAIALIDEAKSRGDGRIYAGLRGNWGADYKVGQVPMYAVLANQDADAVGFTVRTGSFMTGIEPRFDDTKQAQYDVFAIRYVVLPADRPPSVDAELIEQRGRHRLWEVEGSGYFDLVDTVGTVNADRASLGRQMHAFLRSDLPERKLFQTVDYPGKPAGPPTLSERAKSPPGDIEPELVSPRDGVFAGSVDARRQAMVVLKSSFDPRWRVRIDGEPVQTFIVTPGYVGAIVPPGRHTVLFVYTPFPRYGWLVALGVLTIGGLAAIQRRRPRRDAGRRPGRSLRR